MTPIARIRVARKCGLCYLPKETVPAEARLCLSCTSVLNKLSATSRDFLSAWANQAPIK